MRIWDAIVVGRLADVPRPTDDSRMRSPDVDADRILIFGRGTALGWGVLSHDLALPGSLVRALSHRTGRGVDITVVADPAITVHSATSRLAPLPLESFDAIVITFGVRDATSLTGLRRWDRQMGALLRFLDDNTSHTAHVFVMGIQPVRSIPVFDSPLGRVADLHALALNAATAKLCAKFSRTLFVPLTVVPHPSSGRFRSAADYRHWGEILADRMAGPPEAERLHADIYGPPFQTS